MERIIIGVVASIGTALMYFAFGEVAALGYIAYLMVISD